MSEKQEAVTSEKPEVLKVLGIRRKFVNPILSTLLNGEVPKVPTHVPGSATWEDFARYMEEMKNG